VNSITLAALAEFPRQLEAHYLAVPAAYRHWTPPSWEGIPSEHYTAIEQICHVRDIEVDGYHVRLRRTLQESYPTLASINGDALAAERAYGSANAVEVLASFAEARRKTLDMISELSAEQFARTAFFEDYGPLTLKSLLHYLCSHDQQHLAGLQWLLGKIDAAGLRQEG